MRLKTNYLIKALSAVLILQSYAFSATTLQVCYKDSNCILKVSNKKYTCTLGKNGVIDKEGKREGDGKTPLGTYRLVKAYYRSDRLPKEVINMINLVKEEIKPWSLWADDPKYPEVYNTYVDARDYPGQKPNFSAEYLMRSDGLYDLLYVIDYNLDNPVPGLGSAIFLHIHTKPTAGCIGLKREDLFELVPKITINSEIIITDQCS